MAGDEADLVAEAEAVGRAGDGEAAVLVGGALVGGGWFVAHQRRSREGERLQARVGRSRGLAWLSGLTEAPPLVGRPFLLATAILLLNITGTLSENAQYTYPRSRPKT
jgi:hypothetical protein